MSKKYECPQCGSEATSKDKIMGSDTMDRVCNSCGYTGIYREFIVNDEQDDSE